MAEEEVEVDGEEGEEAEGGKKKIPLWIIILVASQVVLVAGVIIAFKMISSSPEPTETQAETDVMEAEQKVDPSKVTDPSTLVGPQFPLDPFLVNLIDDGRGPRYLKVEVKFELEADNVQAEIESRLSQIRDELLTLLSSKRVSDIETIDGKRILKDEIFTRVNRILVTGRIKRVYFTEFVIQ